MELEKDYTKKWYEREIKYENGGISKKILEYCKMTHKKEITVMDIGCGNGYSIANTKDFLKDNGIKSFVIGIDKLDQPKYMFDHFIQWDITDGNAPNFNPVDVIIMLYNEMEEKEKPYNLFSTFLKDDGISFISKNVDIPTEKNMIYQRGIMIYQLNKQNLIHLYNENNII